MPITPFKNIVLIGASGRFGRLFRNLIFPTEANLACFDLDGGPDCLQADAERPDARMKAAISSAELVLLCLPDQISNRALPGLLRFAGRDTLFVESRSVMSGRSKYLEHDHGASVICINPLFAPDLGPSGRPVAVVGSVGSPNGQRFAELLKSWGARVVEMEDGEHDRLAAVRQALVHAAVISFAVARSRMPSTPANGAEPPPSVLLRMLAARILTSAPETYQAIQADNPFADEARTNLMNALSELRLALEEGDPEKFRCLWAEGLSGLGGEAEFLANQCASVFKQIDTNSQ
jgi:prephenate dehydrogenase